MEIFSGYYVRVSSEFLCLVNTSQSAPSLPALTYILDGLRE